MIAMTLCVLVGASCVTAGRTAVKAQAPSAQTAPVLSVAVSGSDSSCVRGDTSMPCASLLRAYQLAHCGDVVSIRNGSYGAQSLGHSASSQNTDAKPCSSQTGSVVFRGSAAAGVHLQSLTIGEPWVTVANITTSSLAIEGWDSTVGCYANPVTHVTVANSIVDAGGESGNPLTMNTVEYVTLSGNTIGNVVTGETEISNTRIGLPSGCAYHNNHLSIIGNTWHDFGNPTGSEAHMECLQFDALGGGTSNDDVVLRRNRFLNCGQYDVYISGHAANWSVERNYFDAPCSRQSGTSCVVGGGAISLTNDFSGFVAQYNTFAPGTYPQFSLIPGTATGGIWRYNINGTFPDSIHCGVQNGWTLLSNLDSGGVTCGSDASTHRGPMVVFVRNAFSGHALRAEYIVLTDRDIRLRTTVYRGGRKLVVRESHQPGGTVAPISFLWRQRTSHKPVAPTRLCVRATGAALASSAKCIQVGRRSAER